MYSVILLIRTSDQKTHTYHLEGRKNYLFCHWVWRTYWKQCLSISSDPEKELVACHPSLSSPIFGKNTNPGSLCDLARSYLRVDLKLFWHTWKSSLARYRLCTGKMHNLYLSKCELDAEINVPHLQMTPVFIINVVPFVVLSTSPSLHFFLTQLAVHEELGDQYCTHNKRAESPVVEQLNSSTKTWMFGLGGRRSMV